MPGASQWAVELFLFVIGEHGRADDECDNLAKAAAQALLSQVSHAAAAGRVMFLRPRKVRAICAGFLHP